MAKKFKSKKRRRRLKIVKFVIYLFLAFLLYELITLFFLKLKLTSSNEEFLKELLRDSNHHLIYESKKVDIMDSILKYVHNVDLKEPVSLLKNLYVSKNVKKNQAVQTSSDEIAQEEKSDYVDDPHPVDVSNPSVYLYNTHQLEGYNFKNYEEYNITPNVMMASYILREKLNKKGISTIAETSNITDFLNSNGWNYASSYKASRYFMKETFKKYKNIKLSIDIHRDAISKEASTVKIGKKNYAKVLFVVGMEHKKANQNLGTANKINALLKKEYPTLTRGVMKKSGKYVNGIYNQDLNKNIILLELGGNKNTIEEVLNTIEILANIIQDYLEE